jgi:hypothetical protein
MNPIRTFTEFHEENKSDDGVPKEVSDFLNVLVKGTWSINQKNEIDVNGNFGLKDSDDMIDVPNSFLEGGYKINKVQRNCYLTWIFIKRYEHLQFLTPREVGGSFSSSLLRCPRNQGDMPSLIGGNASLHFERWEYIDLNNLKTEFKGDIEIRNAYNIESLQGIPKIINGSFSINGSKIKNLIGGPEEVHGEFDVANNNLVSFIGSPKKMNKFYGYGNTIKTLEGLPGPNESESTPTIDDRKNYLPKEFIYKVIMQLYGIDKAPKKDAVLPTLAECVANNWVILTNTQILDFVRESSDTFISEIAKKLGIQPEEFVRMNKALSRIA